MRIGAAADASLLHLRFDVALRVILALVGQSVVVFEATLGRGISLDFHVLQIKTLAILINLAEHAYKLLDRVVLELALTDIGLVDEEFHVGLKLLLLNALE